MLSRILSGVFLVTVALPSASVAALAETSANRKVTVVFDQALPNVPGKSMKGVLVEYGPGGSSRSHRHPASAFIYATVNDGPVKVYSVGESWAERPGDHHRVSANASGTEPAKLLAVFVVDSGETDIVIDDPH
jgi:quercetin dioxygenase-like cupin family protein